MEDGRKEYLSVSIFDRKELEVIKKLKEKFSTTHTVIIPLESDDIKDFIRTYIKASGHTLKKEEFEQWLEEIANQSTLWVKNDENYTLPQNGSGAVQNSSTREPFVQGSSSLNSANGEVQEEFTLDELVNLLELLNEPMNSKIKEELIFELCERYKLAHKGDNGYLILLFVKNKNLSMTQDSMKQLLRKDFKIPSGTAKRIVNEEIGKKNEAPPRNPLFILDGQDPVTDDFYYKINPQIFQEIAKFVYDFLKRKKEELKAEERRKELIDSLTQSAVDYIETYLKDEIAAALTTRPEKIIPIDWNHLLAYSPDLAENVRTDPEVYLKIFNEALQIVLKEHFFISNPQDKDLKIVFKNVRTPIRVRDISASHFGKLISVRGMVSATTSKKKQVYTRAVFVCRDCGNEIVRIQDPLAKTEVPSKCGRCGSKNIRIDPAKSTTVDIEFLNLQDIVEDLKGNEQPMKVLAYFVGEHKTVYPGDKVIATGILRDTVLKSKTHITDFVLEIIHVDILEPRQLEELDEQKIRKLYQLREKWKDELPKMVAKSIAPHIVGWDDVKEGVALAIASKKDLSPDGERLWSHVLLLGDRGVGKSDIIRDAHKIIRGVLVTGGSETKVGLTATVERDEMTGEWMFKAGAIVKANQGVLFIDEGDKIKREDLGALHSPMSYGKLSLVKASIIAELNAYTSVVMASNPIKSYIDPTKPIFEQVPFPTTLLDRFDLIFVMRLNRDINFLKQVAKSKRKARKGEIRRIIDEETLRILFKYAQILDVEWTDEALDEVERFFIAVNQALANAKFNYSMRLWGIITRLAEAHARLRLSEKVEVKDVKEAERLIIASIKSWGRQGDEEGVDDVDWTLLGELERQLTMEEENILDKIEELFKELHEMWGDRIPENIVIEFFETKEKWDLRTIKEYLNKAREKGLLSEENGYWYLTSRG